MKKIFLVLAAFFAVAAAGLAVTAPAHAASAPSASTLAPEDAAALKTALNKLAAVLGNLERAIQTTGVPLERKIQISASLGEINGSLAQLGSGIKTRQLAMRRDVPVVSKTAPAVSAAPATPPAKRESAAEPLPAASADLENIAAAPAREDSMQASVAKTGFSLDNLFWPVAILVLMSAVLFFLRVRNQEEQALQYASAENADAQQKSAL